MFKINRSAKGSVGQLIYKENEFNSVPIINSDIVVLIGYISIGFDSTTMLSTQIWGTHQSFNWVEAPIVPSTIVEGNLQLNEFVEAGTVTRITEANLWKTYYNKTNGWIKFGMSQMCNSTSCVEIFSETLLEIDIEGKLVGIWLHPIMF